MNALEAAIKDLLVELRATHPRNRSVRELVLPNGHVVFRPPPHAGWKRCFRDYIRFQKELNSYCIKD
jgi:hypothetical protein